MKIKKINIGDYILIARSVINNPREFFEEQTATTKLRPVITYLVFLWIVGSVLNTLSSIFFSLLLPLILKYPIETNIPQFLIAQAAGVIGTILGGLLFTLIGAVILHFWIRLFGGKDNFRRTLQLNVYALTPNMLFGWLPIANLVAGFYSVYLMIVGVQMLHKIPKRRAIIMFVVIPIIALIIASIATTWIASVIPMPQG